jgi:hypothetical protein
MNEPLNMRQHNGILAEVRGARVALLGQGRIINSGKELNIDQTVRISELLQRLAAAEDRIAALEAKMDNVVTLT